MKKQLIQWMLASVTTLLFLTACVGAPSMQSEGYQPSFKSIDFPEELPTTGQYNLKAEVASISRCPAGSKCLVADHIMIIAEGADRPYVRPRALMVFADDVQRFRVKSVYDFSFEGKKLLGYKRLKK